tara:strand:+ start:25 stop:669 length:645 start_codon:yes stop_codon:yes gene_type:complete
VKVKVKAKANVANGRKAAVDAKVATTARDADADPKAVANAVTTTNPRNADAGPRVAVNAATTTIAKSAAEGVDAGAVVKEMTTKSVTAGRKVAVTTTIAKNVDAGLRAVATTTIAKSAAGVVDAVADVKAMTTMKNAGAGQKVVANAVTTTIAKSAADRKAVADRMAVSVDAPRVTVAELAKSAKAGEDPKAAVAKTVNAERAVAAGASIAKRS